MLLLSLSGSLIPPPKSATYFRLYQQLIDEVKKRDDVSRLLYLWHQVTCRVLSDPRVTRLATELSSGLEVLYSWSMINVARGGVGIPSFTGGPDDYASA
jgi:hypothetical protein